MDQKVLDVPCSQYNLTTGQTSFYTAFSIPTFLFLLNRFLKIYSKTKSHVS